MIWVKDAPEYGVDHDSKVCDFIYQYVSCKVPKEDCKLKELVLLLQQHKHSSYCKRKQKCRFNFPKPPSCKTLITKLVMILILMTLRLNKLEQCWIKLIAEDNTNMTLNDLLDKAKVTETDWYWKCQVMGMLWYSSVSHTNVI